MPLNVLNRDALLGVDDKDAVQQILALRGQLQGESDAGGMPQGHRDARREWRSTQEQRGQRVGGMKWL